MNIQRGDLVLVTTGDHQGATPHKVVSVLNGGKQIVVEGINKVLKHVRRGHPKSPQGGRLSVEKPIAISNVILYCPSCGKGTRVGRRLAADGSKERFCKKCNAQISRISPPKPSRAK